MKVTVAATQMKITWDIENNLKKADQMIENCAKAGANIVLLQELFETPYFCQKENYDYFNLATEYKNNPYLKHFSEIAKKYNVVLPLSFFERAGNNYFNSLNGFKENNIKEQEKQRKKNEEDLYNSYIFDYNLIFDQNRYC